MAAGLARGARAVHVLLASAALGASGGCELVVDTMLEQCESDGDCALKGGDFANTTCREGACRRPVGVRGADWACLGRQPAASKPEVAVDLKLVSLQEGAPVVAATVKACSRFDFNCVTPVRPATTTDGEGRARLLVPTDGPPLGAGFSGYLMIEAPGYLSVVRTFSRPLVDDLSELALINLLDGIERVATLVGASQDPALGTLLVINNDCQGRPVANATVSASEGDTALQFYYTVDGLPVVGATSTDGGGQALLFNAPARSFVVRVSNEGVGQTAEFSVSVRAGALTVVGVLPDP
ncbi:MAG: hypothetical protein MUF34_31650 [Polyangiaceae bacterium]|jgi:hypothetical protein|nr:hypothetical protein [Polyangiaceae bacterium]